jgi:hypothetical protein
MKKYIKENQVYTVQEGSDLEAQLLLDGFEEFVEAEEKPKAKKKADDDKAKTDDDKAKADEE